MNITENDDEIDAFWDVIDPFEKDAKIVELRSGATLDLHPRVVNEPSEDCVAFAVWREEEGSLYLEMHQAVRFTDGREDGYVHIASANGFPGEVAAIRLERQNADQNALEWWGGLVEKLFVTNPGFDGDDPDEVFVQLAKAATLGAIGAHPELAGWTFAVCGSRTREPLHVYLQHPDGIEAQSSRGWSRFFGDIRREHMVKDAWNLVSGCVADLAQDSRALDAWAAWNEGASDRIPQVGEQVRIWNPLRSKEVVVEVTDTSAKSFEGLFEGGRRMWLPPMTLVKSALAQE